MSADARERIAAIIDRIEKARTVVSDLCHGRRRWTMSVPARPDDDPDLVIAGALDDAHRILSELQPAAPCRVCEGRGCDNCEMPRGAEPVELPTFYGTREPVGWLVNFRDPAITKPEPWFLPNTAPVRDNWEAHREEYEGSLARTPLYAAPAPQGDALSEAPREAPTTCPCGGGPGHGEAWCGDYTEVAPPAGQEVRERALALLNRLRPVMASLDERDGCDDENEHFRAKWKEALALIVAALASTPAGQPDRDEPDVDGRQVVDYVEALHKYQPERGSRDIAREAAFVFGVGGVEYPRPAGQGEAPAPEPRATAPCGCNGDGMCAEHESERATAPGEREREVEARDRLLRVAVSVAVSAPWRQSPDMDCLKSVAGEYIAALRSPEAPRPEKEGA